MYDGKVTDAIVNVSISMAQVVLCFFMVRHESTDDSFALGIGEDTESEHELG